ncbi:MAG: protein kinase [Polyangiaceae bacterium]|nr:protein kinase [Polyangiaceae bacterium]
MVGPADRDASGAIMHDALRTSDADAPSTSGERLRADVLAASAVGRFVPVSTLADGRRARVILADDRELGARVVLKLPEAEAATEARAAVQREAMALTRCRHAGVVELLDSSVSEELGPFLALRYHEGRTLTSLVEQHGALPERWVWRALAQLASALSAVHAAGAAHGDVAPANVLVVGFRSFEDPLELRLIDFDAASAPWLAPSPATLGTVAYLAPERLAGAAPSVVSDVYGFGALAYELLAGVPPFRAATSAELAALHQHEALRALREVAPVAVDPRLERRVLACLPKAPEERDPDLSEARRLLQELEGTAAEPVGRGGRSERDNDELAAALLCRVREYWIKNVLERTTDGVILVRQGFVEASSGDSGPSPVDENVAFSRAFDDSTGTLVLLGEPGFGKTVNLLRLARHLADRAAGPEGHIGPVPVVFTLSSWSERSADLSEWMVAELSAKYQLLRRDAQSLLDRGAIVPLLDGLDDVRVEARGRCVDALNAYAAAHPGGRVVVTCRTEAYRSLPRPIEAGLAMQLRPLADDDIARQLRAPSHTPLLAALRTDPILSELSRTPVLLHVMRVGLRDSRFRGALGDRGETVTAVFSAFVDAAMSASGKLAGRERETRAVLQRVAANLAETGRTVFQFEDAEPQWLGQKRSRVAYAFLSRTLAASVLAAAPMLSIGFSPLDNQGMPISMTLAATLALVTALVLGLGFGAAAARTRPTPRSPPSRLATAARGMAAGLALGAVIGAVMVAVYPYPMAFFLGLESGLIGAGVLLVSRHKCRVQGRDVVPVESLGWSWRNVDPRGAALLTAFSAGFFLLFSHFEESRSGAYAAAALLVLGLAVLGHKSRDLQLKVRPNIGIHRTLRSALTAALLAFLASTILFGLSYGAAYGAAVGLALATMTGLCFGGVDVINHYTLRWLLDRGGVLPIDAAARLDDGEAVGLVRRVGSGYMFMHAMLAQHLARRTKPGDGCEP